MISILRVAGVALVGLAAGAGLPNLVIHPTATPELDKLGVVLGIAFVVHELWDIFRNRRR